MFHAKFFNNIGGGGLNICTMVQNRENAIFASQNHTFERVVVHFSSKKYQTEKNSISNTCFNISTIFM